MRNDEQNKSIKESQMIGQGMTEEGNALQECKQSILVRYSGQNRCMILEVD
jgi:hypothetical protein